VSQTAIVIAVGYAIAVVIGAAISIVVWRSTHRHHEHGDNNERFTRLEGAWLIVVLLALFALLMGTIFFVPYGETAGPNKQTVQVVGVQFAWTVNPTVVRAGVPVEFLATTRDVNHGFGVYDPDGTLIFQAQVIPDQTQKIVHTFSEPGTYEVLCLEFCGVNHHNMITTFEVRA
jgi:cytochrome c oxidase subunit 2